MRPCLALNIIRLGLRVKWSNPGKRVVAIEKRAYGSPPTLLFTFYSYLIMMIIITSNKFCPVGWGSRTTPTESLQRGKTTPSNTCPGYDTKQYDGEVLVTQELRGMRSTPLLPSLPDLLWPRVEVSDRVLSIGKIEQNCVLAQN